MATTVTHYHASYDIVIHFYGVASLLEVLICGHDPWKLKALCFFEMLGTIPTVTVTYPRRMNPQLSVYVGCVGCMDAAILR